MYIITILTIVDMIYKVWTTHNFPWGAHTVCMNTSHLTLTFELDVIRIAYHYIYRAVECAIFKAGQSMLLIIHSHPWDPTDSWFPF